MRLRLFLKFRVRHRVEGVLVYVTQFTQFTQLTQTHFKIKINLKNVKMFGKSLELSE